MFPIPFAADILKYKVIILAAIVVLLVTNAITGYRAYNMGYDAAVAVYEQASAKAAADGALANAEALGRELKAVENRTREHTSINSEIEASHEKDDDAHAPAIIQRTFERLRALDGQAR